MILAGLVHEPETIRCIVEHCRSGDVVHGGAYFGDFLPALSRALAPNAKLWAFEPDAEHHRCACITIKINACQNIELTNAALGARESSGRMAGADQSGLSFGGAKCLVPESTSVDDFRVEGRAVASNSIATVRVVSVDDIVPSDRHVSVLHLDVERNEQQALLGAIRTIERCRPVVILETVPDASWMAANILKLGYREIGRAHVNRIFACSDVATS
jgi:FkbM family methyltransferase